MCARNAGLAPCEASDAKEIRKELAKKRRKAALYTLMERCEYISQRIWIEVGR